MKNRSLGTSASDPPIASSRRPQRRVHWARRRWVVEDPAPLSGSQSPAQFQVIIQTPKRPRLLSSLIPGPCPRSSALPIGQQPGITHGFEATTTPDNGGTILALATERHFHSSAMRACQGLTSWCLLCSVRWGLCVLQGAPARVSPSTKPPASAGSLPLSPPRRSNHRGLFTRQDHKCHGDESS